MLVLFSLSVNMTGSFAGENAPVFGLYDPPFFTVTFEELSDWPNPDQLEAGQVDQKSFYLQKLLAIQKLAPAKAHPYDFSKLRSMSAIKNLTVSAETWNKFRENVFYACVGSAGQSNRRTCEALQSDLLKAFDMGAADHKPHN